MLLFSDLPSPATVVCCVADNLAVIPCLARNRRADDGYRSFGLCVLNVLAQVPAIGVDSLVDLEDRIVDFFGFVTDAMDGSSGTGWIVEGSIIVVPPLEEDDIVWFNEGECLRPLVFHDVGATAAAADSAI